MKIKGLNYIGNKLSGEGKITFQAQNPQNRQKLLPEFCEATRGEIEQANLKAESAYYAYSSKSGRERSFLLEKIADEIIALDNGLIKRCVEETGLSKERLTAERGRTVNQLRLFANLLREGSWVDARLEIGDPHRQPVPKPDIRSMKRALGPVGVFGASNFPLAFSVAGGDTAAALAAGCTVIVKAHPAHPGTCEMVAYAIRQAIIKTKMPDGTFSMVQGRSNMVGMSIARHPFIKAIGFTGSFNGGKAIYDAATKRPEPIPVYAEMSSTNPVFILPGALRERKGEIAKELTTSVTLGAGQFCTNPGLVFIEECKAAREFIEETAQNMHRVPSATMLTSQIYEDYENGIKRISKQKGVRLVIRGYLGGSGYQGRACLLQTMARNLLSNLILEEEIFGPSTLLVITDSKVELLKAARNLKGHLTATLHATRKDLRNYAELIAVLEQKVGRLIVNGFPTGVEVCHSMVHGGPFPATTDSRSTSVGTAAINRFARPVCYQNFPNEMLPDELKDENPLKIWRLVNGEWKK